MDDLREQGFDELRFQPRFLGEMLSSSQLPEADREAGYDDGVLAGAVMAMLALLVAVSLARYRARRSTEVRREAGKNVSF